MCEEYSFPRKRKIVHSHKTESRIWRLSQRRLTLQEICLPLCWLEEDLWYSLNEVWCIICKEVRRISEAGTGWAVKRLQVCCTDIKRVCRLTAYKSSKLQPWKLVHGQTILSRRCFGILSALANSNVLPSAKGVCMTTDLVTLRYGVGQSSII